MEQTAMKIIISICDPVPGAQICQSEIILCYQRDCVYHQPWRFPRATWQRNFRLKPGVNSYCLSVFIFEGAFTYLVIERR